MKNRADLSGAELLEPSEDMISPRRKAILDSMEVDRLWMESPFHERIYGPLGSTYQDGECQIYEKIDDQLSDLEGRFAAWKAAFYAAHP